MTHHLHATGPTLTAALLAETLELQCSYLGGGVWRTDDAHEPAVREHLRRHGYAVSGCAEPSDKPLGLTALTAAAMMERCR